ncbi:MAG: polyketide synthase [Pirellulaceae bacterium]|nr:polyketide synthase [Pirellulaceae bacterium]
MKSNTYLDPQLSTLLGSLRQRVKRYVVWDSVLAILAVALIAFWAGLAMDYLPVLLGGTEMPLLARGILLLVVAILILGIVAKMLIGRLQRPLPDDSLALLVERHHPQLGGRLVTAVQLNEPGRSGDSHSPELLKRVHIQAAAAVDQVDPNRVFRWEPLVRKAVVVVPLALLMIVFAIVSPSAFGRATGRLTLLSNDPWPRRADLEMVGIELPIVSASEEQTNEPQLLKFQDGALRLPRGSSATLRIRARADEAEVPVVCTVYYRGDDGTRGQSNMRRVGRIIDGYQSFVLEGPPLSSLGESFTFSVHGLDDRLDGYRVEAIQPPAITEMNVQVRYPDYLRNDGSGEIDLQTQYQAGLRLSEGSDVTLVATSSVPLGDVDVMLKTDAGEVPPTQIDYSDDRRQLRMTLDQFSAATTVRIVPMDRDGISAQAPYRYFMGVVLDEPPELELRLRGVGTAVTAIAKLPVESVVTDDYGVDALRVTVAPSTEDESTLTATKQPAFDREGKADTVLDLRDLVADGELDEIVPGDAINVFAEANDRYDLKSPHVTRSEVFRLQVVTPEALLALLERRELGMRARLEQTIDETRTLRDSLDQLRRRGFESTEEAESEREKTRQQQVRRLRVQQNGLQASKTSEELSGIAASLDDMLQEMVNNRVDSADRRERIGTGVRDPLKKIVSEPLQRLIDQIGEVEKSVAEPAEAAQKTAQAVQTAEDVLLQLTAVLDKMLDLESYNEILDIFRGLIDDLDELSEETKAERKRRVLEMFEN